MANFVKTSDGVAVNVDRVSRMEVRTAGGDDAYLYLYADGHVHTVTYDSREAAESALAELTGYR